MRSPSPSSESGRRRRTFDDDRPSSSRPPLPVRSPSPTTSNRSSSAGTYSRRPAWESEGPPSSAGALPTRPDFSPKQRRFERRPDRERPGDRDPSGATRPFHERDRDNTNRSRDRERDRDGPGPSGSRDTWLAPGPPGKGRAADDGWASRRRAGVDRNRDRGGRDQREPRPPNGGRAGYDRDGPGPRNADYLE